MKRKPNSSPSDPYPLVANEVQKWFMDLVESMVSKPEEANVYRVRGGNDLELAILTSPEDTHVFTAEVCEDLERQVAERTGVFSPVVYHADKPHPKAKAAIDAAGNV